jgi:hypothetical protein
MQSTDKVVGPSIRLSTVATSTRQTPKTDFGTVMRDGLIKAGNVAIDGLRVAAPFIPGSAIVSAAVAGSNIAASVSGQSFAQSSGGSGASAGSAGTFGTSLGNGGGATFGNASNVSHGFASSVSSLTGGAGPGSISNGAVSAGNFNVSGAMAIPNGRPGATAPLNTTAGNIGVSGGAGAGAGAAGTSDSFNSMMSATRSMAEFQASFNLQYLQLQEKIQQDTRQFNLVSNIMKTKHDAAKNALNNVR